MTITWYFREGDVCTLPVKQKTEETGKTLYTPRCGRCGGEGRSERWARTGFTCFQCQGSGEGNPRFVTVFTSAKLEKLNAARNKVRARKVAKLQAKHAAERVEAKAARREIFLANEPLARRAWANRKDRFIRSILRQAIGRKPLTGGQLDALFTAVHNAETWAAEKAAEAARKAAANYVGEVGKRIIADITVLKKITGGDPYSRFGQWTLSILRTTDGNTLTTFGKCPVREGATARIKFTVKEHKKNDKTGEKETQISRLKIEEAKEKQAA
jgi:hypothetical protein